MIINDTEVVATFPSKKNPAVQYEVTKDKEGILYCTCPAWKFQKKPSHLRQCKHVFRYVQQQGVENV